MTDYHLSRVATWMLRTVGKAVAFSLIVAILGGFIAGTQMGDGGTGGPLLLAFAGVASMLTFAVVLGASTAPAPRADAQRP